jgi:hypothetical protein
MRAEMRFQFGDIDHSHGAIIPNMTILVTSLFPTLSPANAVWSKRNEPKNRGRRRIDEFLAAHAGLSLRKVVSVATNISSFE